MGFTLAEAYFVIRFYHTLFINTMSPKIVPLSTTDNITKLAYDALPHIVYTYLEDVVVLWVVVLRQLAEHVGGQLVAIVGHIQRNQIRRDVVERGVVHLWFGTQRLLNVYFRTVLYSDSGIGWTHNRWNAIYLPPRYWRWCLHCRAARRPETTIDSEPNSGCAQTKEWG